MCLSAVVTAAAAGAPAGRPGFVAAYRQALPAYSIVGSTAEFVESGAITARDDYGLRDRAATLQARGSRRGA